MYLIEILSSTLDFDLVHFMPLFGIVDGPLFGLDLGLFPPCPALFVQVNMVKYDILLKKNSELNHFPFLMPAISLCEL